MHTYTKTAAQLAEGRTTSRRRSLRTAILDVLPVLRQRCPAHIGQHLDGTAVISPSHVRRPSAPRT